MLAITRHLAPARTRRILSSRLSDEGGGATIETVLWLPLVVFVFAIAVDYSMVFHGQSQALRVIQDANRNVSIGRLKTTSAAESYVRDRLATISASTTAVSAISSGVITTTVTMPLRDLQITGLVPVLGSGGIRVSADHLIENWEG